MFYMLINKKIMFISICLITLLVGCVSVPVPDEISKSDKVDKILSLWDTADKPGVAVAVVKDGEVVFQKGYGIGNLEYDIPITENSIFNIASVSKQFTVFSILLLEKEGKLSFDDDIRKYIPEIPDFGKTITLRHLASHTSGLRSHINLLYIAGLQTEDVLSTEHVIKLVSRQKELNFNPGEDFLYCNTGFVLLAEVVARVSGQSFAQFTKSSIFDPLNMSSSLFYDDHEKIVKNRTYSYYEYIDQYKKYAMNYASVGASNLFTSAMDLSQWALNFSDFKVGDKDIVKKMNVLAVLNSGETSHFAYGQMINKYMGLKEIYHIGSLGGYRSYFSRFPDQNLSIIVLSNNSSFLPRTTSYRIADIYLKDDFIIETNSVPLLEDKSKEEIIVNQNTMDSYVGKYEVEPGFIISITNYGDVFSWQATRQTKDKLKAISERDFFVKGHDVKIEFMLDKNGYAGSLELNQNGQKFVGLRLQPFNKRSVALSDFTGRFYSDELSTFYDIVIKNNQLFVEHNRMDDFLLKLFSEDTFTSSNWFLNTVKFVRNENSDIIGFKVSSNRVKNLWFKKN